MLRDARVDDRMAFHTFIKELIYIYIYIAVSWIHRAARRAEILGLKNIEICLGDVHGYSGSIDIGVRSGCN